MVFFGKFSFCQDTAQSTFRITKYSATAAGLSSGTINRQELIDSGGIVIRGCPDCRVLSFKITGKTDRSSAVDSAETVNLAPKTNIDSKIIDPRWKANEFLSKNERFTLAMKKYIGNTSNYFVPYYIEISDILILTPAGEEKTLDKIYLFLR